MGIDHLRAGRPSVALPYLERGARLLHVLDLREEASQAVRRSGLRSAHTQRVLERVRRAEEDCMGLA